MERLTLWRARHFPFWFKPLRWSFSSIIGILNPRVLRRMEARFTRGDIRLARFAQLAGLLPATEFAGTQGPGVSMRKASQLGVSLGGFGALAVQDLVHL